MNTAEAALTDRLGSSSNGRLNGVQAPQVVQPLVLPVGPHVGLPNRGPGYNRDGMRISEDTRAIYAALVAGAPVPAGLDPAIMERLSMVHGPNSDLFQAVRANQPPEPLPRQLALTVPAEPPSETSTFFSRTLKELSVAWQDFANTQAW